MKLKNQTKPKNLNISKESRRKQRVKIRTETNETKNRKIEKNQLNKELVL